MTLSDRGEGYDRGGSGFLRGKLLTATQRPGYIVCKNGCKRLTANLGGLCSRCLKKEKR